jgi:uncharacterized protein YaeQ
MALSATIHHFHVTLSDVDRNVYEVLDLRVARHPSESARYLTTRTLGYCLSYQEGIAFSKGGLSSADEPPIEVRDPTGIFLAWIDVGFPSAERLHKASKAARRVVLYTYVDAGQLQREASTRAIHKAGDIEVWRLEPSFLEAVEKTLGRTTTLELARTDGQLYVTVDDRVIEGKIERIQLLAPEA